MRYCILIFFLFLSCFPTQKESLAIYFEDGFTNDGPYGFPSFSKIESREPNLIHQFDDIKIERVLFSQIERAIGSTSPKGSEFSIESQKISPIYLVFSDSTKNCFFNSSSDFYNTLGEHLFHDINLATMIKHLINYEDVLKNGTDDNKPPVLYYKVALNLRK